MMELNNKSISVILPAYNEKDNIGEVVLEAENYLRTRFSNFEILVVSEGSTDGTNEIVLNLQKDRKYLRLLSKERSCGYAGALRTGFKNASKELIFYTDADGQYQMSDLDKLLPFIDEYDIVTGFKIKRHDPAGRIVTSWIYNFIMKLLFGLRVKDINCAFKLYKRKVIEEVNFLEDLTEGVINVEIYLTALKNGHTLKEVGVNHFSRRAGSATSEIGGRHFVFVKPKTIYHFLKDAVKLWRKVHGL